MKRLGCLVLALVLALALTGCGEPAQAGFFAMDTYMTVTAYGPGAQDAVTACGIHINALERDISRTISGSDVDVLNTAHAADLAPDTDILLALAQEYSAVTGGAFDITVAPLVSLWNVTGDTPHVASQAEISLERNSSRRTRYFFAFSDCSFKGPTWSSSSSILSLMRRRFSCVFSSLRSASSLR